MSCIFSIVDHFCFCSLSGSLQKCSVQSRVFIDYVIITGIKFMLSLPIFLGVISNSALAFLTRIFLQREN